MDMRGYQRYREDSLNTMTQGELLLLLYDELIKRLTQAELSLGQENYEVFEGAVGRSVHGYPSVPSLIRGIKVGPPPRLHSCRGGFLFY